MGDKLLDVIADPGARPVLIAGPTASGKSALALAVAERWGGVVVNADALQVFGCWRVLTARPSVAEEARVPHRLYGHVAMGQDYSVGHWLRDVAALMASGQRLILVGGSGLYFSALTEGLVAIPPIPAVVRAQGNARVQDLPAMLADLDAPTRARIDGANPARVQRAWEVLRATGKGLADWQDETGPPLLPLADTVPIVLEAERDWLAARIEARFAAMMAGGALEEVRAALPYWQPAAPWAKAIGAPELVALLQGRIDATEAVRLACIASQQYAKRQRTWFRARMRAWRTLPVAPER